MQLVRPTLADDGDYRPGIHPEHPAAVEGCRPVSRGLMLELMTNANVIGGFGSCRHAIMMQQLLTLDVARGGGSIWVIGGGRGTGGAKSS